MADEVYEGAIGIDLGMFYLSFSSEFAASTAHAADSIINNFCVQG